MEPSLEKHLEPRARWWWRIPWLTLAIGVSLAFGFLIPSIYELGLKPESRSSHPGLVRLAVLSLIAAGVICPMVIALRRSTRSVTTAATVAPLQFRLREMLVGVTLLALVFGAASLSDGDTLNILVAAFVAAVTVWVFWFAATGRKRFAILLAVTYLPFVWTIAFNKPFGYVSGLSINTPIGPGILAAELLRVLLNADRETSTRMAAVLAMLGIGFGAVLARRGGKLFTAYGLLALVISFLSSFAFHALFRF